MTKNKPKNKEPAKTKKIDNVVKKIDSDADIIAQARERRDKAREAAKRSGALPGQRLVAEIPEGFEGRWVNDTPGRVDAMLKKGYSFYKARKEDGSILSIEKGTSKTEVVGTAATGGALTGYLMVIPKEMYRENQQIKEQRTQTQADAYKGVEHDSAKLATPEGRSELYKPF